MITFPDDQFDFDNIDPRELYPDSEAWWDNYDGLDYVMRLD